MESPDLLFRFSGGVSHYKFKANRRPPFPGFEERFGLPGFAVDLTFGFAEFVISPSIR
jgi:hypothetical protein